MPKENAEVVRQIYEQGMFGQDPRRLVGLATDDVEYVNPPDAVEPGVRRGREAVAAAIRAAHELFDSPRYELHELFDYGETVVASLSFYARVRGSRNEVVQEEAHTWTLREGRITRFSWGRDLEAALTAARQPTDE